MIDFIVVPSKPEFSVSRCGKVMFNKTKYILKPWIDKDGYLRVQSVSVGGKRHYIAVHRAVAEVFVPNPNPKEFTIVNHLNGITHDNRPENLEWTNYKHNRAHCVAAGKVKSKGEKHSQAKLTDSDVLRIVSMINLGIRDSDIAENFLCRQAHDRFYSEG